MTKLEPKQLASTIRIKNMRTLFTQGK